jgi:hypothetical protein
LSVTGDGLVSGEAVVKSVPSLGARVGGQQ